MGIHLNVPNIFDIFSYNCLDVDQLCSQGTIGSDMRRLVRGGCPFTLWRPSSSQVIFSSNLSSLSSTLSSTPGELAVISMLADPNDESPANVDAAKEWRDSYPEFK